MSEELDNLASILTLREEAKSTGEPVDVCHAMAQRFEALGEIKAAADWYVRASKAAAEAGGGGDSDIPVWFAEQAVRLTPDEVAAQAQLAVACAGNAVALSNALVDAATAREAQPLETAAAHDTSDAKGHAALADLWLAKGDRDKAVAWFLKAATYAERHFDLRAALAHVQRAEDITTSLRLRRELKRLGWLLGDISVE